MVFEVNDQDPVPVIFALLVPEYDKFETSEFFATVAAPAIVQPSVTLVSKEGFLTKLVLIGFKKISTVGMTVLELLLAQVQIPLLQQTTLGSL